MQNHSGNPRGSRSGIALIWVVLLMMVFIAFTGLMCDWGYVLLVAHQLQNAADAAALAGAQKVRSDQDEARTLALSIGGMNKAAGAGVLLNRNDGNVAEGDVVVGRYDRTTKIFTPQTTSSNAVKVVARRTTGSLNGPLPLLFGPIFGVTTSEVSRQAIAMIGGDTGAGLIVLDPTEKNALRMGGDFYLDVNDGAIQVNSNNSAQAMWAYGNLTIGSPTLNVVGEANISVEFTGDLNTGVEPIEDPLRFLPPPPEGTVYPTRVDVKNSEVVTLEPGYYAGGVSVTNGGVLNLNPGVFTFGGIGLQVNGGTLNANETMLYIKEGSLDFVGNPTIWITPCGAGCGVYEGMAIFQARDNFNDARITGTAGMFTMEGTIYFPENHLDAAGTSIQLGDQLIVDTLFLTGTGVMTILYDGRNPAPGNKTFLVL